MLSFSIQHLLRLHIILITVLVSCHATSLANPPVPSSLVTSFVPNARNFTTSSLVGNLSHRPYLPPFTRPSTTHTSPPQPTDTCTEPDPWELSQFVRDALATVRGICFARYVQAAEDWFVKQLKAIRKRFSPRSAAGEAEVVDNVEEVEEEGAGQAPGEDEVAEGGERVLASFKRTAWRLTYEEQDDMQCWRRWQ